VPGYVPGVVDISANPAHLQAFERTANDALALLYNPALTLAGKLNAVRSDAAAQMFLPAGGVPYIHWDVLDLYSVGRRLATFAGDVGRAFDACDFDHDGVIDDGLMAFFPRLGNGEFTIIRDGGRVVIDTGDGNDEVTVENVPGGIRVTVNGVSETLMGTEADYVTLRLGAGDDRLEIGTGVNVHFTIEGQVGDDALEGGAGDEVIRGGAGRDYIDGFSGNDELDGGADNDVIYGGDGNDLVTGGTGIDYLEGGRGDDNLLGGADHDILSGGDGADRLDGQGGDDTVYTGAGSDLTSDQFGNNTVYGQFDDQFNPVEGAAGTRTIFVDLSGVPGEASVHIDPNVSPRFRQRMEEDLAMYRSSPEGRAMLNRLDQIHNSPAEGQQPYTVTISEWPGNDNSGARPGAIQQSRNIVDYYPGDYQRQAGAIHWSEVPPSVVMFHEMAHNVDYGANTLAPGTTPEGNLDINNRERVAVGLPIDHDGDPNTPMIIDPNHPTELTENALRKEMGLPERTTYGPPLPPP